MELTTRFLAAIGDGISAARYVESWMGWNTFGRAMGRFHETYDLYLTPTVAALPPLVGSQAPSRAERALMRTTVATGAAGLLSKTRFVDQILDERLAPTPFTQLANLTGLPAMSVPLHHTPRARRARLGACPSACSSSAARPKRRSCCGSRRSSKPHIRGSTAGPRSPSVL